MVSRLEARRLKKEVGDVLDTSRGVAAIVMGLIKEVGMSDVPQGPQEAVQRDLHVSGTDVPPDPEKLTSGALSEPADEDCLTPEEQAARVVENARRMPRFKPADATPGTLVTPATSVSKAELTEATPGVSDEEPELGTYQDYVAELEARFRGVCGA